VIEVYRDNADFDGEDIYLDEFKDEIDEWVIDALKEMGCVTAKSVINTPREELIRRADLEEETVDNVLEILKAEFEDEEEDAEADANDVDAESEEEPQA
jgi:N utilization substance protein A